MRRGPLFVALVAALTASACGGGSGHSHEHGTSSSFTVTGGSGGFAGGELSPPQPTPDFTLTDQSGRKVSMSDQRGKLVLVTFLYTNCPDVCPLITQNLNQALQMLAAPFLPSDPKISGKIFFAEVGKNRHDGALAQ